MPDAFSVDVAGWGAPLDEALPCGPNLEYDADFLLLEQAAQGKPEVEYGDSLTAAVPPDWNEVLALARRLMPRSRDLRLAVLVARALLNLHGAAGFAAGLALVEQLVGAQWQHVHPQLDADDDNDPLLRVNILASLCESSTTLQEVRTVPLVSVRAYGSFSLRDIQIASGEVAAPAEHEGATLAVIDATFSEAGHATLAATAAALTDAGECSQRIEQLLTERVGAGHALDLAALTQLLRQAADVVRTRLPAAPLADQGADAGADGPAGAPARRSGEIGGRADVIATLDRLCAYYASHEPASPVPLLLQRARRLVDKSFTELLQDLAPEGLGQWAQISGISQESHDG